MENTVFSSPDEFDDIGTIDGYHVSIDAGLSKEEAMEVASLYSRDNARTPMQWSAGKNAGFSEADPWLPVNPDYKLINVSEQLERQDSVLNFYRQLSALRKDPVYRETLVWGELEPVYVDREGLMAYYRRADRNLMILANLKSEPEAVDIGCEYKILLAVIGVLILLSLIATIVFWGFGGAALLKVHQARKVSWWQALKLMVTRLFRISPRFWGQLFVVCLVSIILLGILLAGLILIIRVYYMVYHHPCKHCNKISVFF